MWYFAWILGVLLACSFGIINALWLESADGAELDCDASDSPALNGRRGAGQ
jgi:cyd operon protein YbgT